MGDIYVIRCLGTSKKPKRGLYKPVGGGIKSFAI